MEPDRRLVAVGLLAAVTLVTLGILRGLVGTLFFAVTVAYVLAPQTRRLERRGLPAWWAAAVSTASAYLFGLVLFVPIAAVLYVRRQYALDLIRAIPDSFVVTVAEFTFVVDVADVQRQAARGLTSLAIDLARATPVLAAKLVVFGFVLFALVYRGDRLRPALLEPLPAVYRDVATEVHERVGETLFVPYFIQAATAVATFVLALVVFVAFGVRAPVTLAVLAGVLQFLPVVGPSLVVLGIVVAELVAGDVVGAVLIGVVGLLVIGVLPDAALRPRLARDTARLPASLYFVGFTGGVLSLGPVGIIAGPVAVAILLQLVEMLEPSTEGPAAADP